MPDFRVTDPETGRKFIVRGATDAREAESEAARRLEVPRASKASTASRETAEAEPEPELPGVVIARGVVRGVRGVSELLFGAPDPEAVRIPGTGPGLTGLIDLGAEAAGLDLSKRSESGVPRVVEKVAEELGAAALPAGGVARAGRAALAAGRTGGRFVAPFLRFVGASPGRFAAGEAAAATGAGVARSAAPETPGAQLGAGIAGAFAPGVAGGTARRLLTGSQTRRAEARVAGTLRGAAGDPERAAAKIDESLALQREVPGMEVTTAQAARDPGLLGLEATESAKNPRLALRLMTARESGQSSVVAQLARSVPATEREVADAVIRANASKLADGLDAQIVQAQGRLDDTVGQLTRGRTSEDIAVQVRDVLTAEGERAIGPAKEAYRDLDRLAESVGASFDAAPIRESILGIKRRSTRAEGIALPRDLVESMQELGLVSRRGVVITADEVNILDLVPESTQVPFQELQGLNRRLNREIAAARATPEGRSSGRLAALGDLKAGVHRSLDAVEESSQFPQVAREFRRINAEFGAAADRFRKGVVGQVLEPQRRPPAASATLDFFFKRGKGAREAARDFKRAVEGEPEGLRLMEDFIVSKAWDVVGGPEGLASGRALTAFASRHRAALSEFPGARAKLRSVTTLQNAVEESRLARDVTLKQFQESTAALFLKETPKAAVNRILRSGNPAARARELKQSLSGHPDAIQGAARVFWDELIQRSVRYGDLGLGVNPYLEPNSLRRMLDDFEPVIRELQGHEHARNLRRIFESAELAFQGRIPKTARNVQRSILEGVPLGFAYAPIYSTRMRVFRAARSIAAFLENLDIGQAQDLMEEAIVNPELARTLLTKITPANEAGLLRRLRTNLLTLGHRVSEEEEGSREPQQVAQPPAFRALSERLAQGRGTPDL